MKPLVGKLVAPPPLMAAAPQPLTVNPFESPSSLAPANPFATQLDSITPQPVPPDAWTFQPQPARGTWLEQVRAALGVPVRVLSSAMRAGVDRKLLSRRTRRSWQQMRAELALLALRAHGVVVHQTRGRLGAIVLATAPVLLLSAAAGLWLSNRAPIVKQAQAAVEVVPTDADIARILRSRTGFTVTTEPPGARINVDGRATDRVTPERVSGFAPGLHSIELRKAGYYDTNLAAVLEEGSTLVLPPVILRALPVEHIDPAEQ